MIWLQLSTFLIVVLGLIRLGRDPRATRTFWIDSAFAVLNFGLYALCGALIMLLLWEPNVPRWHNLLLIGFVVSWIGYGFVWLTRAGPRLDPAPADRGGPRLSIDGLLLSLTAGFGASALIL